jgi:hypothetical protein
VRPLLVVLTVALILGAPSPLVAAEADSTNAFPRLVDASRLTPARRPSPGVATLLSHGAMIVPIVASAAVRDEHRETRTLKQSAVVAVGLVVGPTTGYWYGDVAAKGQRGLLGRLALAGVFYGTWAAADAYSSGDFDWGSIGLFGVMVGSAGTAGVWALWDAARVAPIVEAHNLEVRGTSWRVEPAIAPASGAPGVALTARF